MNGVLARLCAAMLMALSSPLGAQTAAETITRAAATGGPAVGAAAAAPQAAGGTVNALTPQVSLPGGAPPVSVNAGTVVRANDGTLAPLFGASLFTGAFSGSVAGARDDYLVEPGDAIDLKTFGGVSLSLTARVGADGTLFVPVLGPVRVGGVRRDALNATLQAALSGIYTNTRVYAEVVQPGAIGVYVTGNVARPGRYLGASGDGPLYFLDKAGGVDGRFGSYRNILIRHAGGATDHLDLYDFLLQGAVPPAGVRDGDVIVVAPRGPVVVANGLVQQQAAFELISPGSTGVAAREAVDGGRQLLALARPDARLATDAYVHSVRGRAPVASYVTLDALAGLPLGDGDHVELRSDRRVETVTVSIQTSAPTPSVVVVPRGTTLTQVLAGVRTEGTLADRDSTYLLRPSVAAEQKRLIEAALLRLQADALAASALSTSSTARGADAGLVQRFVEAARQVQPDGRIATVRDGRLEDLRLEDGDRIVIPDRSDVVLVAGEVLNPGAFAHRGPVRIGVYVNDAGGFTPAANRRRLVLHKPNGIARLVDPATVPEAGDRVVVVPAVRGRGLEVIRDITTILFQIALSTATILRL